MDRRYSICSGCKHASWNDDDISIGGCRAFLNGIPTDEIGDIGSHDKPIDGQVGDYVYTPTKRKVSKLGAKITIHQDSNPYADENGRYKPN